jgi:hypothetical protein
MPIKSIMHLLTPQATSAPSSHHYGSYSTIFVLELAQKAPYAGNSLGAMLFLGSDQIIARKAA